MGTLAKMVPKMLPQPNECGSAAPSNSEVIEMAWISVHGSVNGPKLRSLSKSLDCSLFEALGILNFIWMWGLENADQNGLILCADEDDIARYLYGAGSRCKLNPQDVVNALIENGWIDREGSQLYFHDWATWQSQWYKAKSAREKDTKRKRDRADAKNEPDPAPEVDEAPVQPELDEFPPEQPEAPSGDKMPETAEAPAEQKPKKKRNAGYTKGFETFWSVYPRQVGKGEAYKKYNARLNDGFSEDELLMAAKEYARQCKMLHTENQFIKHPKTFLGENTPFIDYLPKAPRPAVPVPFSGNPFEEYGDGEN